MSKITGGDGGKPNEFIAGSEERKNAFPTPQHGFESRTIVERKKFPTCMFTSPIHWKFEKGALNFSKGAT